MSLDVAYILGAGLGTRMGPVGEVLPKLLWPVFEKSLLELQIDYAHECGIKKIYINTHFQAEIIHSYIREKNIDVEVLYEETLLDIGGAVHNLAKKLNYKGRILILNGDQFLFIPKKSFEEFTLKSFDYVATLLGLSVAGGSSYNELKLVNGLLSSIEGPDKSDSYYTYSGVSIINLSKLKPSSGKSKFFESVANFSVEDVYVYKPDNFEYWDFGTTERYCKSMRKTIRSSQSIFRKFLEKNNALIKSKISNLSYANKVGLDYSINLSGVEQNFGFGNIVLKGEDKDFGNLMAVVHGDNISKSNL